MQLGVVRRRSVQAIFNSTPTLNQTLSFVLPRRCFDSQAHYSVPITLRLIQSARSPGRRRHAPHGSFVLISAVSQSLGGRHRNVM